MLAEHTRAAEGMAETCYNMYKARTQAACTHARTHAHRPRRSTDDWTTANSSCVCVCVCVCVCGCVGVCGCMCVQVFGTGIAPEAVQFSAGGMHAQASQYHQAQLRRNTPLGPA